MLLQCLAMVRKLSEKPKTAGAQFVRYILVGCCSAAIELGVFQLLYLLTSQNIALSNATALVSSTAFNFCANRSITFKDVKSPARSALLYVALLCANTVITTAAITWLTSLGCLPLLAKLLTMACVVAWNFVLYRKVIFA